MMDRWIVLGVKWRITFVRFIRVISFVKFIRFITDVNLLGNGRLTLLLFVRIGANNVNKMNYISTNYLSL